MQKEIVERDDKVMLVIAGPGSGKTRVLVHKVLKALKDGVPEDSILLLTFTNKAAQNMVDRIDKMLNKKTSILGGTFHHVANRFLRKHAYRFGYRPNYSIIDEDDSITLIKSILRESFGGYVHKLPKAETLQKIISYCRNSGSSLSSYLEAYYKGYKENTKLIQQVWEEYATRKKQSNVMDFDDLLTYFNELLDDDVFRNEFHNRFTHIFVDEFQDTNRIQFEIIRKMHSEDNFLFVVGDDCQSIYSFRAAEIRNMLKFGDVFPNVSVFYLTENYRSCPRIVTLINEIIKRNKIKFDKRLEPVLGSDTNDTPAVHFFDNGRSEAEYISKKISALLGAGVPPSEIAVLYRSNYQSAHLEVQLSKLGIKYVKLGGLKFFEQAHIKDVIAYLKISSNMTDELAWSRFLKLFDGIGEKTVKKVFEQIRKSTDPLNVILAINNPKLDLIKSILTGVNESPVAAAQKFLDMFYISYLKRNYQDDFDDRRQDLEQLLHILSSYHSTDAFLEDSLLDANLATKEELGQCVVISTVHQAKGLEWDHVFIIGLVQGRFPSKHALNNTSALEEERRLFYVGCSRARKTLELCVPLSDKSLRGDEDMQVSQFITELPDTLYTQSYTKKQSKNQYDLDFVSADTLL
ncbi:MAG: ATP-dependent helicase [Candidatus Micrarchaeia archaeon]